MLAFPKGGLQKIILLDFKDIQLVSPKENQSWMFVGRTEAKAEAPIFCPPVVKNWLIGKDPDAGQNRRQGEKGTTENEMIGWHPWLNGHEFEQALGVGDGQGGLACCRPWGCKELDTTERLNWTDWKSFIRHSPMSRWLNESVPWPSQATRQLKDKNMGRGNKTGRMQPLRWWKPYHLK